MGKIKLKEISTRAPKDLNKDETREKTQKLLQEINELQNLLYAESKYALLVVLQGLDASGKDGAIRKVFTSVNPQGITVQSFKVPTEEEMRHDFLWRVHSHVPGKGMIQVFNRSHYEDILVTRVHGWCTDELAKKRMKAINDFEQLLDEHSNTRILKFYLHISQEEQLQRLQERIKDPTKQWKYNEKDFQESAMYNKYHDMYEDAFENCDKIPWIIVPADQNWYKEYIIAKEVRDALKKMDMQYPGLKKE